MKLENYKTSGHKYTEKASDICRQLNFAGIGIVWIIITTYLDLNLADSLIIYPLVLISLSLMLDVFHYILGGYFWTSFYGKKEKEVVKADEDIKSPRWKSNILYVLYYSKLGLMILAYIFIVRALLELF